MLKSLIDRGRKQILELNGNVLGTAYLPTNPTELKMLEVDDLTLFIHLSKTEVVNKRSEVSFQYEHKIKFIAAQPVIPSDNRCEASHDFLNRFKHVLNTAYWGFKPTDDDCGCIDVNFGLVPDGDEPIKKMNNTLYHIYDFVLIENVSLTQYKQNNCDDIMLKINVNTNSYPQNKLKGNDNEN